MRATHLTTSIAIFALLFPPVASAAVERVGYSENHAEAYFSSVQGCDDVVVGVSVVKPTSVAPQAPLAPTQAFVFGTWSNICDIGSSYSFADVVNLSDSAFQQKSLQKASLNLVTNIGGFDLAIDLDWKGVGEKQKHKNKVRFVRDGIIVRDVDVIASRASENSGTFLVNGINYAVGTKTGGLSSIRAHTVTKPAK